MKPLIIIPTYNELDNIQRLIPELMALDPAIRVLVVDDNSPDGTGKLVDDMARENDRISVLHRPAKLGLGSAYVAGFKYAVQQDVDCVFEMDADFSHDPAMVPEFIEQIKSCDVVIGSRYISGINVVNWPMSRLLPQLLRQLLHPPGYGHDHPGRDQRVQVFPARSAREHQPR